MRSTNRAGLVCRNG